MELTIEQALQQGVTAHKEGNLQDAERLYQAILQSQPLHPDANHNLGILAVSVNQAEAALPLFKTALEANPKIEQFWLSYIDTLIKEKQFENAKLVIEQAKTQGVAEEKLNNLEAQLPFETQIQNVNSANPPQERLSSLLECYQTGQYGDVEKLAVSITQEFPQHQLGWKVLGAVLKQTGRASESLVPSQRALQLVPKDAEAHYNLGVTLQELGRLDEAEASCRQAIALEPDFAEAHSNLGVTLQELGRLDEAEASSRQAIALEPDFAEAHSNLSVTLQELGRLDEAEASSRQAIALKPDFAEAHNNLGNTIKELGRLDEAEASSRQAIALKPDYAKAHYNLGNTLKELGRLDEAEACYTQAITLKPDFADALYNRSHLLFDKAQYEAALRDADACILKKAKVLPLISLYALGRVSEIYKRLELQSKSDAENISLAAFATFISEVEKKPTTYNFCPNPIDFINIANLSSHVNDSVTFLGDVIEELNKIETMWEPSGKATVSGFQSLNDVNLFKNPTGKIAQLKSIIINEIEAYYLKFQNEQCSYIQKFPTTRNLFGWTVTLKQQGHQNAHIHTHGWLSGVIYLKVVPSLGKDEGAIEFSLNGKNYSDLKSPKLLHQPVQGDIVFFPSSLHHRTIPFTTDADRIIVSFDLKPEVAKS
jgi:tetratricopeptide (TPR) repeat protein